MALFSGSLNHLQKIFQKETKKNNDDIKCSSFTKNVLKFLVIFTRLLKSSDGRDKFCALIQYLSKFYGACVLYTLDIESQLYDNDIFKKFDLSKRIEKSMSSGRKIFRFLKFIDDLKDLYRLYLKQPTIVRIFEAFSALSSLFFHVMDNLVWASKVTLVDEYFIGEIRWKMTKNFFNLVSVILKFFITFMKARSMYQIYIEQDAEIRNQLLKVDQFSKEIQNDSYEKIKNALLTKTLFRLKVINLIRISCRICMLSYSLKIEPFFFYSHPVYVAFCGIIFASLSILQNFINVPNNKKEWKIPSGVKKRNSFQRRTLEKVILNDYGYFDTDVLSGKLMNNYYIDFNKDLVFH